MFLLGEGMYQFKDEINYESYFRFDKKPIEDKNWALLPLASKSTYPVIGFHRNRKNGVSFPSQETMAILSGRDIKTVRKGQKGLDGFPGIEAKSYVSRRGKRGTEYKWIEPPYEKGRVFQFHNCIIESGIWNHLTESAQALYPVMRYFSFLDWMEYIDFFPSYYEMEFKKPYDEEYFAARHNGIEDFEVSSHFDDFFTYRYFEFCDADNSVLKEYAGISKNSLFNALRTLEEKNLIYRIGSFTRWLVIVRPQTFYKRDYLNERIKKKFDPWK